MMSGTATPYCLITKLVSSHKYKHLSLFFISIMCYCLGVGVHSTFNRSLSFEHVNYSGTSGHAGDDGGAASDIDAYDESVLLLLLIQASTIIFILRS